MKRTRPPRKRRTPRRKRPELFYHPKREPIAYRDDGREICTDSLNGQKEYRRRVALMLVRQQGLCCNCLGLLSYSNATFEHENGRGAAKRDDRIVVNGKRINGASHLLCNQQRGSKRTPIWHGELEAA